MSQKNSAEHKSWETSHNILPFLVARRAIYNVWRHFASRMWHIGLQKKAVCYSEFLTRGASSREVHGIFRQKCWCTADIESNLFIFRFVSEHCLHSILYLLGLRGLFSRQIIFTHLHTHFPSLYIQHLYIYFELNCTKYFFPPICIYILHACVFFIYIYITCMHIINAYSHA